MSFLYILLLLGNLVHLVLLQEGAVGLYHVDLLRLANGIKWDIKDIVKQLILIFTLNFNFYFLKHTYQRSHNEEGY